MMPESDRAWVATSHLPKHCFVRRRRLRLMSSAPAARAQIAARAADASGCAVCLRNRAELTTAALPIAQRPRRARLDVAFSSLSAPRSRGSAVAAWNLALSRATPGVVLLPAADADERVTCRSRSDRHSLAFPAAATQSYVATSLRRCRSLRLDNSDWTAGCMCATRGAALASVSPGPSLATISSTTVSRGAGRNRSNSRDQEPVRARSPFDLGLGDDGKPHPGSPVNNTPCSGCRCWRSDPMC